VEKLYQFNPFQKRRYVMLKKIISGCLLFVMVSAMSTVVMAAGAEIHGFVGSNFGQENTGVEDTSAYNKNTILGVFDVSASGDKFAAGAELNVVTIPGNGKPELDVVRPRVEWMATEQVTLIAGEVDPTSAMGYARTGGTWTPFTLGAFWDGAQYARALGNGLHATVKPSETMDIILGMFDQDVIGGSDQGGGSGYHGSIDAAFDPVSVRLAYMSGTTDDPSDATDDALSSNSMLAGVKLGIGESFSVSLDYSTKTVAQTKDTNNTSTCPAFQFTGKDLGPGNLILTYANEVNKNDDGETIDSNVWTNVVYEMSFNDPDGKLQLLYLAKENKIGEGHTTAEEGDTTTESFVGIGMAKFF
jgi:hypothetical protein